MNRNQRKNLTLKWLLFFSATIIFASGCASTEKNLTKNDLKPITSMQVMRFQTPPFLKETKGSQATSAAFGAFGIIGDAVGGSVEQKMMEKGGKELQSKYKLPDFGETVFTRFLERIPKEINGWPQMIIVDKPVTNDSKIDGYALVLSIYMVKVRPDIGVLTVANAELKDKNSNILWKKSFRYATRDLNRPYDLETLEANNGKLLHEEYEFAIENTVAAFIKDLKGEP